MKLVIFSDVHLQDYRNYNLFDDPRFRLNQFKRLGKRIKQIGQQYGAKTYIIAGDFFHVANPAPHVQNVGFDFLEDLTKDGDEVYITQGQHDSDSRTFMSDSQTILSICSKIPRLHYMHKKGLELGGKKFWFQGWTPEQDFSQIAPGEYDYLIGHATISNSKINQYDQVIEHGQDFESNKFTWCFMGDIHYHQVIGNQISIGVPIQSNFNDHPDVGVIILDTDTGEWFRVSTITEEFPFLRLLISDSISEDPYTISRPPTRHEESKKLEVHKSINVVELVEKLVQQYSLSTVHSDVLNHVSKDTESEVSLMFKILEIQAVNYRSIISINYSPVNGVKVIKGSNGSGKSTLLNILDFVLNNHGDGRTLVTTGMNNLEASVTIDYQGLIYKVIRGWNGSGYLEFYINDKLQESENKRATEAKIRASLPFLERYDLMYHDQDRPKFLSGYNYNARVDMISRALDLKIVEKYHDYAADYIKTLNTEIQAHKSQMPSYESTIEQTKDIDFSKIPDDPTEELNLANNKLAVWTALRKTLTTVESCIIATDSAKKVVDSFESDEELSGADLDFDAEVSSITSKLTTAKSEKTSIESELRKIQTKISTIESTIRSKNSEITSEKSKLDKTHVSRCYTCNSELDGAKIESLKCDITDKITKLESEVTILSESLPALRELIQGHEDQIKSKNEIIQGLNTENATLGIKVGQVASLKTRRDKKLKAVSEYVAAKAKSDKLPAAVTSKLKEHVPELDVEITDLNSVQDASSKFDDLIVKLGQTIADYISQSKSIEYFKLLKNARLKAEDGLRECETKISELEALSNLYSQYRDLMSSKGEIVISILKTVSDKLSDNRIKVVAHKTLVSGDIRPDFNLELKVGNTWRSYDYLSGGQKVLCDIFIIRHLINLSGGVGMLIFDESLKELDAASLEFAVEYLKDAKVNDLFIISHVDNFPDFDQQINARLNNERTEYTFI